MPPKKKKAQYQTLKPKRSSCPQNQPSSIQSRSGLPNEHGTPGHSHHRTRFPYHQFESSTSRTNHNIDPAHQVKDPYATVNNSDHVFPDDGGTQSDIPTSKRPQYDDVLNIGKPECVCQFCGAMFWYLERLDRRRKSSNPVYTLCCQKGRVYLPLLQKPPQLLAELLTINGGPMSKHFRDNIRPYNGSLCFTSFGATIDPRSVSSRGPYSMVICGENYHRIGSLLPPEGGKPKFAQLYIFEPENEIDNRLSNFTSREAQLSPELLTSLLRMLDDHNELVQTFRRVRQQLQDSSTPNLKLRIFGAKSRNRQYDLPVSSEIAALIPGDFVPDRDDQDIIVDHVHEGLKRITSLNPKFDALHFPLLFPYGEDGYHPLIKYRADRCSASMRRQFVTQREYYAYRLQYREAEGHTLVQAGKALQHYCIDAYSSVELNRLAFLRTHQTELRAEVYQGLQDAMARGDLDGDKVGHVVLPGTYIGSPRYMQQLYHDAMAVVEFLGNPDLFITFTCNALWDEISQSFDTIVGSHVVDKPMVVSRVFHMKLNILIDDIKRESYFGKTIAIMYTVEFQKKGLPHIHLLVWLAEQDKLKSPSDIDQVISAEIPDPQLDPVGYEAVVKYMLHGPCGESNTTAPCMKDKKLNSNKKCGKHFPKEFNSATSFDKFGNVVYKRSNSGIHVQKKNGVLDNRHVVPYNRNLLVRLQAHINVEVCHKGKLIKYLFKYVTKGPDRSLIIAEESSTSMAVPTTQSGKNRDEIQQFIDCRSLSSYEAIWRLNEYPIHFREPSVVRLGVHLDGQQKVPYRKQSSVSNVLKNPNAGKTHLTEWFVLNQKDPEARNLTYSQIPTKYTWLEDCKEWSPRKRNFAIGRVAYVPPGSGDVFFLRILLTKVRGATSYVNLRTVEGEICADYEKACEKLGLLADSSEWIRVLNEISGASMPNVIRNTFVSMLMFCEIPNPSALFQATWRYMGDDYAYQVDKGGRSGEPKLSDERLQNWVLRQLQQLLGSHSASLEDFNLPVPHDMVSDDGTNPLINDHLNFEVDQQQALCASLLESLNKEQLHIYSAVINSVHNNKGCPFFLYGHGGTGKTYLYNAITAKLRSLSKIVVLVASSGIAATLLPKATTAHSRFKIPLTLDMTSTCPIKKGTHLAELLREASLIIWDEAPMTHRQAFEAVDRSLCDIMNIPLRGQRYRPFGGKTVLFGGDFRQTLPVITEAGREQTVDGSLTRSHLWKSFTLLRLHRNMRINVSLPGEEDSLNGYTFPAWVLALGDGRLKAKSFKKDTPTDWVQIPPMFLIAHEGDPTEAIVDDVYDSFVANYDQPAYLSNRAIITPTNAKVSEINEYMLQLVPGDSKAYYSSDSLLQSTETADAFDQCYPVEFLNTLKFNGVPDHELVLKNNTPVMLLRNLNPALGLCNGTRIMITMLGNDIIKGNIMGGTHDTDEVIVPRIVLNIESPKWPFILKRRQFPVRLCYGMTINKSQGQTLDKVGIYLPEPVFSHGQLYVAVSRVKSARGLRILINNPEDIPHDHTRNIVFREAFADIMTD